MLTQDLQGNNRYYYEDDYMFFSFAGKHSKQYNLFITNEKKGFTWYTDTGASVKVEKPLYQEYTYYTNTDRSQKKCDLDVAAEGLSDAEIKNMLLWLEEGKTGFLTLDWNKHWGYDVVLAKVTNPQQFGSGYKSVLTFKLTFQTIGEFKARAAWDLLQNISPEIQFNDVDREQTIANEFAIPELDVRSKQENNTNETIVYLPTIGNQYGYVDYSVDYALNSNSTLKISTIDPELQTLKTFLNYNFNAAGNVQLQYYGRTGYLLCDDKQLVESVEDLVNWNTINVSDIFRLKGTAPQQLFPKQIKANLNQTIVEDNQTIQADTIELILSEKDLETLSYMENLFISISVPKKQQINNAYGNSSFNDNEYPIAYYNWLVYLPFGYNPNKESYQSLIGLNTQKLTIIGQNIPEEYIQNGEVMLSFYKNMKLYYGTYNMIKISSTEIPTQQFLKVHKYNNL